jgi:hypothetical protein
MWWNLLIGPITNVVDKILDSVLPDNMSERERTDAKMKMQTQLFKELQADREDMKDARKMAMKEMDSDVWVVRLLRGLFRPITGYAFVALYAWSKVCVQFGREPIPMSTDDYYILGGILGFYFGLRSFYDKRKV